MERLDTDYGHKAIVVVLQGPPLEAVLRASSCAYLTPELRDIAPPPMRPCIPVLPPSPPDGNVDQ